MLDVNNWKRWMTRLNRREKTIYNWGLRLEKLPFDDTTITDVVALNKYINDHFPTKRVQYNQQEANGQPSFCGTYQLISAIKSYLKCIGRRDLLGLIDYPRGKMPRKIKYLTRDQLKIFIDAIETIKDDDEKVSFRLFMYLLIESGARKNEIFTLTPNFISFQNNTITIPKEIAKGKEERDIYFSDSTKNMLLKYIDDFKIKRDDRIFKIWDSSNTINNILISILKKCNLPRFFTPHSFRHTFATNLINTGTDIRTIQMLLGHQNISSTEIYTHVDTTKLKSEASKNFIK